MKNLTGHLSIYHNKIFGSLLLFSNVLNLCLCSVWGHKHTHCLLTLIWFLDFNFILLFSVKRIVFAGYIFNIDKTEKEIRNLKMHNLTTHPPLFTRFSAFCFFFYVRTWLVCLRSVREGVSGARARAAKALWSGILYTWVVERYMEGR